ncbi:MAG: TetR/AcrR family transcriptional regulator [Chloroflexota bacterium]
MATYENIGYAYAYVEQIELYGLLASRLVCDDSEMPQNQGRTRVRFSLGVQECVALFNCGWALGSVSEQCDALDWLTFLPRNPKAPQNQARFDNKLTSWYNCYIVSNETRQRILETTANLLERQGYHATGLNEIVKESDTPRGSLYYYFPSGKEEIAEEAVRQRMSQMADYSRHFLSQIDDPIEAIVEMIMHMAKQMEQDNCCSGAPIASVALEASNTSPRIRKACEEGYQALQDVMAAKLVLGGFSSERADALSTTINVAIEGGTILSRTKQDPQVLVTVAKNMKLLLENASRK